MDKQYCSACEREIYGDFARFEASRIRTYALCKDCSCAFRNAQLRADLPVIYDSVDGICDQCGEYDPDNPEYVAQAIVYDGDHLERLCRSCTAAWNIGRAYPHIELSWVLDRV